MTPTTPSPISDQAADERVKEFETLCDLIPEDAYWGMPLTPDLVRHIRAGCTAATAGSEPVAEVRIHTMWSSGGCTGFNDYLMTDYTIRTLKASDLVKGQVFLPNDGSYETVPTTNPHAASLTARVPPASPAVSVLSDEQIRTIEHAATKLENIGHIFAGDKESRRLAAELKALLAASMGGDRK